MGWGARYLTGENLKVVLAEFSTLSSVVLLYSAVSAWQDAATSRVESSAQGSSCQLKFVHDWVLRTRLVSGLFTFDVYVLNFSLNFYLKTKTRTKNDESLGGHILQIPQDKKAEDNI